MIVSLAQKLVALTLLLGVCATSFAQQKISGTVVDPSGEPLIGAGVVVQGTTNGVVTGLDGTFSMSVQGGAKLVVSCVGFADQIITVEAGKSVYNVSLAEDTTMLEETVVIGYGTAKVRDLTGSVATVSSKDLSLPVANVAEALQGKMAGVVVTNNDGTPGAAPQIRVRGSKSITQTNDPLYIVDGFPVSNLSSVPADQIKSINVLKDAAATAIYGSRGAAGVVLVTTKNAVEGQTQVTYNGYIQVKDSSSNVQDVAETMDYLKFTLAYARDFSTESYDYMLKYFGNDMSRYKGVKAHNYQNDLYKTAISHSHNITVSNGTKRNRTVFNVNYMNDDGTVINSFYNRINTSIKTIENLTDNLRIELSANYDYTKSRSNGGSSIAQAYRYRPIDNPLGDPANTNGFGEGYSYVDLDYDPTELINANQNTSYSHNIRGILAVNYNPIKDLTLRAELGLSKGFSKSESYCAGYGTTEKSAGLSRSESGRLHLVETIQYNVPFKTSDHRLDIMIGHELNRSSSQGMSFSGYSYPEGFSREQTLAFLNQYTKDFSFNTSYGTPGRSVSAFARANYALMDKYMFTFTFRADGSSKFAPNNRWGYFPAGAFAWRISDEKFMKNAKSWLSNLKLRLSYGLTGSDAISANLWAETWGLGGNTNNTMSDKRTDTELDYGQAYGPDSMMANPDLKWESTISRNVGLDFSFFNERLYGSIEGYWMTTKDLLMPVAVNASTGYSYQYQNMGETTNNGLELSIGGDMIRKQDYTFSANFIYNYNVNKITKLADTVLKTEYGQWGSSTNTPSNGEFRLKVGEGMGFIRAYRSEGWYTTADFDFDPTTKVYTLKPGVPDLQCDEFWTSLRRPKGQKAFPGAVKWADEDGDGVLTEGDLYEVGEMTPRSTGSFSLSARLKNWDISANFNFAIGGHIMNCEALYSSFLYKQSRFGANRLAVIADAYSPYRWNGGTLELVEDPAELDAMNANASMHTPTSMKGILMDTYIESGSYLRLKNLTVGYTIPQKATKKIHISNLRLYLTATNLLTFTKYSGLNPEVNTARSGSYGFPTPGIDRNAYPIARAFTFGLNVTF